MKNIVYFLVIFLSALKGFSQTDFPVAPQKFKKIHFVYEQKSNYTLKENGVYADTLLLAYDFPNTKFTKVADPENQDKMTGFLPYSAFFLEEDKRRLIRSVYNDNQIIDGEYDSKKDQTILTVTRDNKEIKDAVKKYFKDYSLKKYVYSLIENYKDEETTRLIPGYENPKPSKTEKKEIMYEDDDRKLGYYKANFKRLYNTNRVYLNPKLDKRITPEIIFSNTDYGVEKITTLFNSCQLQSVNYLEN